MADLLCEVCGSRKLPLVYTTYCPNDCDRLVPRRERVMRCPYCHTDETEPFADCSAGDWHCLPNGHVWWADGQET